MMVSSYLCWLKEPGATTHINHAVATCTCYIRMASYNENFLLYANIASIGVGRARKTAIDS